MDDTQLHVPLPHVIFGNARDDGGREAGLVFEHSTNHVHSHLYHSFHSSVLLFDSCSPGQCVSKINGSPTRLLE